MANFFAQRLINGTSESGNIGLGSPQFGQGVYFSQAVTELRSMIQGVDLYSVDRWFLTISGVLQTRHARVSAFLDATVSHLQCGHILALSLISFPQPEHLTSIYRPCVVRGKRSESGDLNSPVASCPS